MEIFRKKNEATYICFPLIDSASRPDLKSGAGSPDSEISKDRGTFADCTNEATEIATSSGIYYLSLTATEMNADDIVVIVKSSDADTQVIVIRTRGIDIDDVALASGVQLSAQGKLDVNAEADTALGDYDPPTRAEATTDKEAVITEVDANETKIDALPSAQEVWEYATRTLSSFGTLIADIWAYATRTLTSLGTLVDDIKQKAAGTYDRETDSLEAIRDRGDIAWSKPIVGDYEVTITIKKDDTDGDPIPEVSVSILNESESLFLNYLSTDGEGQVVVALNAGTYKVRLKKTGVTFTVPETLVVTDTQSNEYYGVAWSASSPPSPDMCVVYGWILDTQNNPIGDATIKATLLGKDVFTADGYYVRQEVETVITDNNGYFELSLIRSSQLKPESRYAIEVPILGYKRDVLIPDADNINFKDLV